MSPESDHDIWREPEAELRRQLREALNLREVRAQQHQAACAVVAEIESKLESMQDKH